MALRVLVVDDDPLALVVVRRILESSGHQVSELRSGFGFAVALRTFDPNVVLLDLNMPGLGGAGALRSAREVCEHLGRRPKVLLHSGSQPAELQRLTTELGADGYVCKPAAGADLLEAVEAAAAAQQKPTAASPR